MPNQQSDPQAEVDAGDLADPEGPAPRAEGPAAGDAGQAPRDPELVERLEKAGIEEGSVLDTSNAFTIGGENWFSFGGEGGVKLVGVTPENFNKLLISLVLIGLVAGLGALAKRLVVRLVDGRTHPDRLFWGKQAVHLVGAGVLLLGLVSVWFDDPSSLIGTLGLVTAGLAFALQKVVTSVAGYFVILRGNNFRVGDRIVMGGVRGDVLAVRFTQTVIMEMGQPPSVQAATPEIWVRSRQYTGRVVSVPNAKIFEEPIYNYSAEFPFIWEEMTVPVSYKDDRAAAERVLMEVAAEHAVPPDRVGADQLRGLQRRYPLRPIDLGPAVFYRLTDNWLELTVRFVAEEFGVRGLKDKMSRDILRKFDAAGVGLASATSEIVGLPPVEIVDRRPAPPAAPPAV